MWKLVTLLGLSLGFLSEADAQLKRFYSLSNVSSYDTVNFKLNATSGISYVRSADGGNPLNIFGNPDLEKINPSFSSEIVNNTCHVELNLEEFQSSQLGHGLVFAMFSDAKEEKSNNYWKLLLNDQKIYNLDLRYGMGSSDIDLSGTSVRSLKVTTGSADIKLGYLKDEPNFVDMDSLLVKVDLGNLEANDLNRARARYIIAEIGFGNAMLDLGSSTEDKCDVKASVGAGNLTIKIPKDTPAIIHIKDSPLCGISMLKDFEQVEKDVYVNMNYNVRAKNLLTFNVDVSLGNVDFVYAD